MAGIVIRLVPKRLFDFGTLTPGVPFSMILASRIDVSQYIDAILAVRIHSGINVPAAMSFTLVQEGFTPDDPTLFFTTPSSFIVQVPLPSGDPWPALATSGSTCRGQYAALTIGSPAGGGGPLNLTASVDLILRSPDPT